MKKSFNAHLLSLAPNYRNTGISLYIKNLLKAIDSYNYKLTLFHSTPEAVKMFKNFEHCVSKLPTSNPNIRILWEQLIQPLQLSLKKIDLLHCPMHVIPLLKISKTKTVITIHDLANFKYPMFYQGNKQKYLTYMTELSAKRADKIIAASKNTKKDIIEILKVPEKKIEVIYNGNNLIESSKEIDIQKKLNLPEEFLLFVGTMEPRKNLESLLDALLYLYKDRKEKYNLVIAGPKGWLFDQIELKINEYRNIGQVITSGYLTDDELIALYKKAKIFIYPSLYEGFGFPVLEAMKLGVPVICSKASSLPEIGEHAGERLEMA
jgi:glycosyltransferase involved in cell wall biosynthesis